ncbi:MAG: NAD-glutamate dehydrogenase [Hyphomicrobiaceae bacterium]|nr:NAD-glutamate dehydrogenase [Hyphomicrobiaceae bacterium]
MRKAGEDAGLARFFELCIDAIDAQDLDDNTPEEWVELLTRSHGHLGERRANPYSVTYWRLDEHDPWAPAILDIYTRDMPFLVDSVLAALRDQNAHIRAFIHPILPVEDRDGAVHMLAEPGTGGRQESFLQVQINPVAEGPELEALTGEIEEVLTMVRRAVRGWRPMLEKLKNLVSSYRQNPPDVPSAALAEALHFLAWLADHNFTFLGMREYRLEGHGPHAKLEPIEGSGLGILEDPKLLFLRNGPDYVEMTEQHVAFLQTSAPIMVTKSNIRSRIHRRGHMDYVGVKLYGENGQLSGELRVLGLFTSMSLATPHTEVPIIRRKISDVMKRSGHDANSHAGKALMAALDNYPRDELFQIGDNDLYEFATVIAALPDRPQVRVLPRIDRFDNYVSALLFVPRERYDSSLRRKVGEYLADQYDGRVSAYYPHFPEGEMVRVHFIIGRNGGTTPRPRRVDLEAAVTQMTRSFADRMADIAEDPSAIAIYSEAFGSSYQSAHNEQDALGDIAICAKLEGAGDIAVRLKPGHGPNQYVLRFFHADTSIPLSDRVPMLEAFGFRVIDEESYNISPSGRPVVHLNEMHVAPPEDATVELSDLAPRLEEAIHAIWDSRAESDPLNKLVVTAGFDWTRVTLVRAFAFYLRQIGLGFTHSYVAHVLNANAAITRDMVELFFVFNDPAFKDDRNLRSKALRTQILTALESVTSLDEDRILRRVLNLVENGLRTNFFQRDEAGNRRPALAIKYDSAKIEGMPEPKPYREIHVYSPEVEGIHLRGGPIARGGIRWSDRPQDFRTEILGLVKAQMTKNAVIVPVGAKGGFIPKQMPANPDRETFMTEGTKAYKTFIGTLLDVTDNLDGDNVVHPQGILRRDGDDPYLVVAADKGTASFSDTANAISQSRHFWLDDAFASGGSAGYDHKKMGITARGAWETVKRHFREMNRDIQTEPFTAAGVGDMSGDVFGNGMLLSEQTRLVAAFDHRDIFIDPDPDPATSFAERKRLFDMGRSSWQDYDLSLISKGGGVFPRSAKSVSLTPEIKSLLGLTADSVTPAQLMTAILCARVDLLWFGGIGTYIRATSESNADAGDRANDAIRITGQQVNAKVVGEGANLGVTQRGRIEFAQKGGRINTDAIDNSAGVNSSDLEVNIKIALGTLVRAGEMTIPARNDFLVEMTEEVAALCLRNNYLQGLAISLAERKGADGAPDLLNLVHTLEASGTLHRDVEFLPDDGTVFDRMAAGHGFPRPEIAVLLAYAKNALFAQLLNSSVPDDPYLGKELYRYFPDRLAEKYPATIDNHRLRREVIATVLCNAMINRGGPGYVTTLSAATSADAAQIACAYAAARDAFGLTELNAAIDARDNNVTGDVQLALYREVQILLVNQTLWFLRNVSFDAGIAPIVEVYRAGVAEIRANLTELLPPFIARSVSDQAEGFEAGGTPEQLARRIAELSALTLSSDIIHLSQTLEMPVIDVARAYFAVLGQFRLGRITELSGTIHVTDRFDRMALDRALANLMRAQRDITGNVLTSGHGPVLERHKAWNANMSDEIGRIQKMVHDLTEGELTVSRLSVAAGLLSDLARG